MLHILTVDVGLVVKDQSFCDCSAGDMACRLVGLLNSSLLANGTISIIMLSKPGQYACGVLIPHPPL